MSLQFSVIVVCYNQARFLRNAVHSVLNQSLQNFELIIVDDGSTDGTHEIIAELQREYPKSIRGAFHENFGNKGLVHTYQLGISHSKAEYLAFLEADDVWSPRYLETKDVVLREFPELGVVFSPYKVLREGFWGWEMSLRQWILHRSLVKGVCFDNFRNLLRKNNVATFSAFVVRRAKMSNLPEPCDSRMLFFDWWVLLHLSACTSFYIDTKSYVVWRQRRDSTLGRHSFTDHKKELINFYVNVFRYFQENIDILSPSRQEQYMCEREKLPLFVEFYQSPSFKRFSGYFRRDPVWALDALASYIVNSWKYSPNT